MAVLIAVLNWGLGHASRCVPLIRSLTARGLRVIIASDGEALYLLRSEFPALPYYELPAYGVRYSRSAAGLPWSMLKQLPRLNRAIHTEHRLVDQIIRKEQVQLIISDNRYGAYHPAVRSVWLGHQLQLLLPRQWRWLAKITNAMHHRFLSCFHEHWVPDLPGSQLSGVLSAYNKPVRYTGVLSRFYTEVPLPEKVYPVVAVLSGPEPQRTLLEEILRAQLPLLPVRALLVRGVKGDGTIRHLQNHDETDFLTAYPLNQLLRYAELVVARSGYSTIMDLAVLGKKALLVPTPGQPEQEYLATRVAANHWAMVQPQHGLSLLRAWNNLPAAPRFPAVANDTEMLESIISNLINRHEKVYR